MKVTVTAQVSDDAVADIAEETVQDEVRRAMEDLASYAGVTLDSLDSLDITIEKET